MPLPSRPFDVGETAALQRVLSDLEAGTTRQWYWLELSQQHPAALSRRVRTLAWLLRRGGPALAWPWLRGRLAGTALYATPGETLWRRLAQVRQDALLAVLCSGALLAGFERLAATQAFAAWCIAGIGALWQAWRVPAVPPPPELDDDSEILPGPESSLGLAGMLMGRGLSPQAAMTLVASLRQRQDAAVPALLAAMPELAPPPPTAALQRWLRAGQWLFATLPVALVAGVLPSPWGMALGAAWGTLLAARNGRSTALLVALAALIAYALGRLGHAL
ncbi:hypothetical protein [Chitinolyticbacter meiyuanensis]|uniref:hypothetical protein n=1 Tax=Chitinolyticbacter meiyuanensis TaxID=682798 RepID=UPI0011E5EC8F|nr:hypothetical protein [Chitinolyticbacter meiyuanensis]